VSNLDLPTQAQPLQTVTPQPVAPARGFVPYPVDPAEPAVAERPLHDPTPGYFTPDPAQALALATPVSRRQLRRARRIVRQQISEEALRQAAAPISSTPTAPYGRDRRTGEPLSDKHRLLAAFLQLAFGAIGTGRFYIGDLRTGFATVGFFLLALFGTLFLSLWFLFIVLGVWTMVDFILIISGQVRDGQGRKLR